MGSETMLNLPPYIEGRLRQPPKPGLAIVPQSTPVVAFGDFFHSQVATLGLNPSRQEFVDRSGSLLVGNRQRFESLTSLGVDSLETAPTDALLRVVDACVRYFSPSGNPYIAWFRQLESILRSIGASYAAGSACHLD